MKKEILNRILDYLARSIILQAFLTVSIIGTVLYLIIANKTVPEGLMTWANIILGAYFGSKVTNEINRMREK